MLISIEHLLKLNQSTKEKQKHAIPWIYKNFFYGTIILSINPELAKAEPGYKKFLCNIGTMATPYNFTTRIFLRRFPNNATH